MNELGLLLGSQLHHRPLVIGVTEGGEDPSMNTKIGMPVVATLFALPEAQYQAPKLLRRHIDWLFCGRRPRPPLHLRLRDILDVSGNPPHVALRILHAAMTISIKLICRIMQ